MDLRLQHTLGQSCRFEGKGLHTGKYASISIEPAPVDSGIRFLRTDIGEDAFIKAVAENVSCTARSTTLTEGEASVATVEHILSALTGMGVDNAIIRIDNDEVPILDGSARPFVEAIVRCGLREQDRPVRMIELADTVEVEDENTGSFIRIEPSDSFAIDLTVDFGSRVLGVQSAHWEPGCDFASEIAPCRTFVFFHEIEFLAKNGLVKGGDVNNAIIIVEHPVTDEQVESLCSTLGIGKLAITDNGYLNNIELHFPEECGRHKMLDIIGDLTLCGGRLKAKVTAFKPGHKLNTNAAKAVRESISKR